MPRTGQKSLTVSEKVFEEIMQERQKLSTSSKVDVGLNIFLEYLIHLHKEWSKKMPRLSKFGFYDNKVGIFDSKKKQIIEVNIIDGELRCQSCESDECIHIGFALSLDEVRKLMLAGEIKKPKIATL
jgi:hypothetical protein